ncbi:hypothetical protein KM043_009386 [Ampulex compressa]|nr:hypothetical protein KM043_009386 [Ampulex compressa]
MRLAILDPPSSSAQSEEEKRVQGRILPKIRKERPRKEDLATCLKNTRVSSQGKQGASFRSKRRIDVDFELWSDFSRVTSVSSSSSAIGERNSAPLNRRFSANSRKQRGACTCRTPGQRHARKTWKVRARPPAAVVHKRETITGRRKYFAYEPLSRSP